MENKKRISTIVHALKVALKNVELLDDEDAETELQGIHERMAEIEKNLDELRKAII